VGRGEARADLDKLVRRLRGYTVRTWRSAGRADRIRRLAIELAAISRPGQALPEVPDHALADAIAVLGLAALDTEGGAPEAHRLLLTALGAS
jgi:hypothetical protein